MRTPTRPGLSYTVGIPLLVAACLVLIFVELVVSGFSSEGCRFARTAVERRASANEAFVVQAMMLVAFALVLVPVLILLRDRRRICGQGPTLVNVAGYLGLAAFVLFTFLHWNFLDQCSSERSAFLPDMVMPALPFLTFACGAATLGCIIAAYLSGLTHSSSPDRK
jgi:hypothetical protein